MLRLPARAAGSNGASRRASTSRVRRAISSLRVKPNAPSSEPMNTFSATVMLSAMFSSWLIRLMPWWSALSGLSKRTGAPSRKILPPSGV